MNKFIKTSITSVVLAGTLLSGLPASLASAEGTHSVHNVLANKSYNYGTLDLALVNDERLLDSLIKRGVISKNATDQQKQDLLNAYLVKKGNDTVSNTVIDPLADEVKAAESKKSKELKQYEKSIKKADLTKDGKLKEAKIPEYKSPGVVKQGKLLTLTVEFSDYAHNSIKPDETDNYYSDYNLQHYEDMIFGDNGVTGPNGENFVSQKQYYEQQSGGTYTIEGKAYGWLKVPGTAAFYGADAASGHDNVKPGGSGQLVRDTLLAAKAAGVPLQDYDLEDSHDLDGDGNLWEPDGLVDHLQIIHAGVGQEAGGGSLGDNAIWSHRSAVFTDPDGLGKGLPGFYDYTVMPEDGATGVFAHEYGHDLGLPDEYDTIYSGTGEAVGYWSIMASGSWAGKVPGTEPTGFSPWAKQYFQATLGGEWFQPVVVNFEDLTKKGTQFVLDQANSPLGKNNQAIRVNLPSKYKTLNTPKSGTYEFWGGQADEIDTNMVTSVDLTGKTSAELTFDAYYDIEEQWDFAFVQVSTDNGATWTSLENANTRKDMVSDAYPTIIEAKAGFTGNSNGWQAQSFDLTSYAGQKVQLRLRYITDWGTSMLGFFADNVKVVADGQTVLEDGGESETSAFTLNGFTKMNGSKASDHYYLLEWRNHSGVDKGLASIARGSSIMKYDGGLVVWYADDSYTENWTGAHPGDGYLGVVDAHVATDLQWKLANGKTSQASTRYHIADAAFGLNPTSGLNLNYPGIQTLTSPRLPANPMFDDSQSFANPFMPDAGRNLTNYGLKVRVTGQTKDKGMASIVISK